MYASTFTNNSYENKVIFKYRFSTTQQCFTTLSPLSVMFLLLIVIHVLGFGLTILNDVACDPHVENRMEIPDLKEIPLTDNEFMLQCTVYNFNRQKRVHFRCRYDESDGKYFQGCYENCLPIRDKFMTKCSEEMVNGTVVLKYFLSKTTMPSGTYFCSHEALDSHTFKHIRAKNRNTTKETNRTNAPELPFKAIRFEFILLILLVLIVSVTLNLIFLVRCLLIRNLQLKESKNSQIPKKCSEPNCLCIQNIENGHGLDTKNRDDTYDNIRDIALGSDTSKSVSSSGLDLQTLLNSSTANQFRRSATFPVKQAILVRTPTDHATLTTGLKPQYTMSYVLQDGGQCLMAPALDRRQSVQGPYEREYLDPSMRQFASTGSLNHRPKRLISSRTKASPLPEENQNASTLFMCYNPQIDEGVGSTANDASSTYEMNSSQGTCISGKESDSFKDPVRSAKLEMSREMMTKADTLLREAHNLLKHS